MYKAGEKLWIGTEFTRFEIVWSITTSNGNQGFESRSTSYVVYCLDVYKFISNSGS